MASAGHSGGTPDTATLYGWMSRNQDGAEGVITVQSPSLGLVPLIANDERHARSFRNLARQAAMHRGYAALLVAFDRRPGEPLDVVDH